MKNNFLTIPDFPNYEINSDFVVRNKKTGHLCKLFLKRELLTVTLYLNGKQFSRSVKKCRKMAEALTSTAEFRPVPSLDFFFEVSKRGVVRDARTKIPIKSNNGSYSTIRNHKRYCFSVNSLLWETFGIKKGCPHVPVVLSKNDRRLFFDNAKAAARFIANQLFFSVSNVYKHFIARKKFVLGYCVNYLTEDNFSYAKKIQSRACRQKKSAQ